MDHAPSPPLPRVLSTCGAWNTTPIGSTTSCSVWRANTVSYYGICGWGCCYGDNHFTLPSVFSAASDATLKLWDAQTGQCTATLRTHKDYIKALAYSPVTNMVVSAGLEHSIFMWDLGALVNLTAANNTITSEWVCGCVADVCGVWLVCVGCG